MKWTNQKRWSQTWGLFSMKRCKNQGLDWRDTEKHQINVFVLDTKALQTTSQQRGDSVNTDTMCTDITGRCWNKWNVLRCSVTEEDIFSKLADIIKKSRRKSSLSCTITVLESIVSWHFYWIWYVFLSDVLRSVSFNAASDALRISVSIPHQKKLALAL